MKIYISLDLEGVSGIIGHSQITLGSLLFDEGRKYALNDVSAVVSGAINGGATEIVICDGHDSGLNLPENINGVKAIIKGENSPFSMMTGIDESYDKAMFVGYHSRIGTPGVLAHTYYPGLIRNIYFDQRPVGEFEINSALATYYGAKTVFISGDDIVCREATLSCSQIYTAVVKKAYSHTCAACYSHTHSKLEKISENAVTSNLKSYAPLPENVYIEFVGGKSYNFTGDYSKIFLDLIDCMKENI